MTGLGSYGDPMTDSNDPRPFLYQSFDQTASVVGAVRADDLGKPTPCSEFDVAALLGHLVVAGTHVLDAAVGRPPTSPDPFASAVTAEDWAKAFDAVRQEAVAAWEQAGGQLDKVLDLGWGQFPGALVARIYQAELTTHSWDLAKAIGRRDLLDDRLAEVGLPLMHEMLPASERVGDTGFGPVVEVPADAPVYDRLAGWMGRQP
jgi:uncharacterized protein (TIGR03086 family)